MKTIYIISSIFVLLAIAVLTYALFFKKDRYEQLIPAIPPEDYKGTLATWMVLLQTHQLWDGNNPAFYGELMITEEQWWSVLEEAEAETEVCM